MLAKARGIYHERPINGPLGVYFESLYIHRLPNSSPVEIVIVPDGTIDVQWLGGNLRVAGPDRGPQTETLTAGTTVIGFRFRPASAAAWLGVPASEILNARLPLEDLLGSKVLHLTKKIGEAHDLATLVEALESGLAKLGPSVSSGDITMRTAFELLSGGAAQDRPLTSWLAGTLALSERTMRRRFEEAFGYGPATLNRILRFQRFLQSIHNVPNVSVGGLAFETGYADHAHLIRESQQLAGHTPREIWRQFASRSETKIDFGDGLLLQ